jgi:hypothetical protein
LVVTWADTWTRRLTTLICADPVRMSLVRRSLPPTKRAAEGRIEVPRIAPKVPSAHVTPKLQAASTSRRMRCQIARESSRATATTATEERFPRPVSLR